MLESLKHAETEAASGQRYKKHRILHTGCELKLMCWCFETTLVQKKLFQIHTMLSMRESSHTA